IVMRYLDTISTVLLTAITAAAPASLTLQAQDSGIGRYIVTANDIYRAPNSASVFKLVGGTLEAGTTLETNGWGLGGTYYGTNAQALAPMGGNVCVFISDPGSDDIASFVANGTSATKVGNYFDPSGSGAYLGTSLAARGSQLFAGYSASLNIGVWTINSDCSITLANAASNTPIPAPLDGFAVSPDGLTVIATYAQSAPGIGSFAVSGSTLTPKGPYSTAVGTAGVDITKDSHYAIVGEYGGTFPQIEIFPINPDSSLGAGTAYSFPQGGFNSNNLTLSPDETRVFVTNNSSGQVTTLAFNEQAPAGKQLTFFCISSPLTPPPSNTLAYISGVTTAFPSGKGGYLYVVEASFTLSFSLESAVALLQIPPDTCPVEVSGSPFALPAGSSATTLSAYPPRPF
ncbi:MAG TPA: hypothetical protein VKR61_25655, partial [Bryobacteraceae bacterium]|nr:hypothetical protein [Bryobacteraceae bacterium]